mgnify:CR=1 FL=1
MRINKYIAHAGVASRRKAEELIKQGLVTINGMGNGGNAQNSAMSFIKLKDWSERGKGQGVFDIMNRANARFADIPEAQLFVMAPPARETPSMPRQGRQMRGGPLRWRFWRFDGDAMVSGSARGAGRSPGQQGIALVLVTMVMFAADSTSLSARSTKNPAGTLMAITEPRR